MSQSSEFPARILVVEDDLTIQVLLKKALESFSHVRTEATGLDGLRAFSEWHPDLLITDVMLPGLDGIQLTRAVREKILGRTLPILVVSAAGKEEMLMRSFDEGADDFMSKPVVLWEVRARTKALYARRRRLLGHSPETGLKLLEPWVRAFENSPSLNEGQELLTLRLGVEGENPTQSIALRMLADVSESVCEALHFPLDCAEALSSYLVLRMPANQVAAFNSALREKWVTTCLSWGMDEAKLTVALLKRQLQISDLSSALELFELI